MRRVAMLKHTVTGLGIDPLRLRLQWASAAEGPQLAAAIDKMVNQLRELGPLSWPDNWQEPEDYRRAVEQVATEHAEAMEVLR